MPGAADRAVIVMSKRPAAGVTKTRLMPELSPQQAADLYECLLRDTLTSLQARSDCTVVIALDSRSSGSYFAELAPGVASVVQVGDTLGERLDAVLSECLGRGFRSVLAISSDSPDLPPAHLDDAFGALDRDDVDVVLGPTEDGGYYLIGWKRRWRSMVTDVTMSTPDVLADTTTIAVSLGARVHLAPGWYDIDVPEDLDRLRQTPAPDRVPSSLEFLASL